MFWSLCCCQKQYKVETCCVVCNLLWKMTKYWLSSPKVQVSGNSLSGVSSSKIQGCTLYQHTTVCAGSTSLKNVPLRPGRSFPVKTFLQRCLQGNRLLKKKQYLGKCFHHIHYLLVFASSTLFGKLQIIVNTGLLICFCELVSSYTCDMWNSYYLKHTGKYSSERQFLSKFCIKNNWDCF